MKAGGRSRGANAPRPGAPQEQTSEGAPVIREVDIVLFDTFAHVAARGGDYQTLFARPARRSGLHLDSRPALNPQALHQGAAGYLSKALPSQALVMALEDVHAGSVITTACDEPALDYGSGDWPGRDFDLSPREAEVHALIAKAAHQPRDRGGAVPEHQLDQVLHPQRLPQDRCADPSSGGLLGLEHGFGTDPHQSCPGPVMIRPERGTDHL